MAKHLKTFENFQENELNPNQFADAKPTIYLYVITNEAGEGFEAEVRDEDGKCILEITQEFIDGGNMDHKDDLTGLREYLVDKKKIRQNDEVIPGGNFTQQTMTAPTPVMEAEKPKLSTMQFYYSIDGRTIEGPSTIADIRNEVQQKYRNVKLITNTFTVMDLLSGQPKKLLFNIPKRFNPLYVYVGTELKPDHLQAKYDSWGNIEESTVFNFDEFINESDEWTDQFPGGRADKKKPEDYDQFELDLGKQVEKEHTNLENGPTEIAMDHLEENPKYYTEGFEKGIFDEDVTAVLDKWKDDERSIKLRELLSKKKESKVEEAEQFTIDKNYLRFGDSFTSIPEPDEDSAVMVHSKDGDFGGIYYSKPGVIYYSGDDFDKSFDSMEELVKWLNDNKYSYVGIDDRY